MFALPNPGQSAVALFHPPAARTAGTIAVVWDKPAGGPVEGYDVFLNGALAATTPQTDHTFRDLSPATAYDIAVKAKLAGGRVLESNTLRVSTLPTPVVIDIAAHGAVADGETLNTNAIQSAIDACPAGGLVRIPAGRFRSGALFLKSDLTLHLDAGATLLGSANPGDYPVMTYRSEGREKPCYASLINTPHATAGRWKNITISGPGKIDGSGSALRLNQLKEKAAERGRLICIRDTDGLYLQDVEIRQSPFWCLHPIYCRDVAMNQISIHTRYDEAGNHYAEMVNGDGIDPDSCDNVFIFNCDIISQDDGIALKSGRDADGRAVGIPVENVRITNCRFEHGFGIAMGSEMSGGLRNVLVEDCTFKDTFGMASVKAIRGRGNYIQNVTYRDCTLLNEDPNMCDSQWCRGAIYVDQFYGDLTFDPAAAKPVDDSTPVIHDIAFQNITLDTVGGNAIYLCGLPERPLENIRFDNVTAIGKHGLIATNIRGLTLDAVAVDACEGTAMRFTNVKPV